MSASRIPEDKGIEELPHAADVSLPESGSSASSGASHKSSENPPEEQSFSVEEERLEGIWRTYRTLRASGGSNWQSPLVQGQRWRNMVFGRNKDAFWSTLDRVQLLGDRSGTGSNGGHTGCVNALSWSESGEVLISSGDDHRLCMWREDHSGVNAKPSRSSTSITTSKRSSNASDDTNSPSFACFRTILTGHTDNVFNAHFLPHTNDAKIATCARDRQVRVFDITRGNAVPSTLRTSRRGGVDWEEVDGCCTRVLKCHKRSVKRIVTEDSPNYFLTVSEDHTVRRHDLRTSHTCQTEQGGRCPAPLIRLPYSLSTIACSPLTPFYFVVAGESSFGHLFDRRMTGRVLQHEWGVSFDDLDESSAMCVRRFGRLKKGAHERGSTHVTGARMAKSNGHELLLSYSGDATYLFSIRDSPYEQPAKAASPSVLPPNEKPKTEPITRKRRRLNEASQESPTVEERREAESLLAAIQSDDEDYEDNDSEESTEGGQIGPLHAEGEDEDEDEDDSDEESDPEDADEDHESHGLKMPVVIPRRRYAGACNVRTVKDVNFLGPNDEWVTSGSDDGNFFIWSKFSSRLTGIWDGDGSVVNVVEDRPASHSYPMLAVSGIDSTVKLFAPVTTQERKYCRTDKSEAIIANNASHAEQESTIAQMRVAIIYSRLRSAGLTLADLEGDNEECTIM